MEDLLKNIPENLRDKCIVKDGVIYCPERDIKGNIIRTAQDIIDGINKISLKPSAQDILNAKLIADNVKLLKENEEQKKLNAELLLKIAILGGKANVQLYKRILSYGTLYR